MKPRHIAIVATALLVILPAQATHSDEDPIPDDLEDGGVPCGPPIVDLVLEALMGIAGDCDGPTDYKWATFEPEDCPACTTTIAKDLQGVNVTPLVDLPPQSTPPVDQVVTTLKGYYIVGPTYCLGLENVTDPLQCVNTAPIPPGTLPPLDLPVVWLGSETVDPPPVDNTTMDLRVGYRHIDANMTHRLGPGLVDYYDPVNLTDPGAVEWWARNGNQTSLVLHLTLYQGGAEVQAATVSVPYLGQLLGAAARSADETLS